MAEGVTSEPPKFSLVTSTDPLRNKLWKARQDGKLADFQIEINGIHIPCHKLILSMQSEYFNTMLQHKNTLEVTQGSVELKMFDVDTVTLVLDFLYSGRLVVNYNRVQEVIEVVNYLQLSDKKLEKELSNYIITHLRTDNCIGWFKFGGHMSWKEMEKAALSIMMKKFSDVCKSSEFVDLSFAQLAQYMKHVMRSYSNHDECLKAFVAWAMHDAKDRQQKFEQITQIISLDKCSGSVLKDIYENQGKVLLNTLTLLQQFTGALAGSVVANGATFNVIVAGGSSKVTVYNKKVWSLNLQSGRCVERAAHTEDGSNDATCASPGGLICAGGTPTKYIMYHKSTDTWVDLPALSTPISGSSATCVQDALIMVMGGYTSRRKAICLDLRTRNWILCEDMPQGMVFPIIGSIAECVFVIFPTNRENEKTRNGSEISVQCYDTTTSTWTFKSPLPDSIKNTFGARAVTLAGLLYLVGGKGRICARYDPASDKWTVLTRPRDSHSFGAALVMNGKILLSGGCTDGKGQDNIEEYDPATDTWRLLPVRLPTPLYQHCMIVQ